MIRSPRLAHLFAATLALAGLARAQSGPAAGGPPPTQTLVSFLVVAGAPDLKDGYFESTRQRLRVAVSANASAKSTPAAYDGPSTLSLYGGAAAAPAPAPAAPGKPAAPAGPLLARVDLPKGPQALVLLGPGPAQPKAGAPAYTAFAVPDDWASFPAGTARVLNYCGKRLQVTLGEQTQPGEAGPSRPVRVIAADKPQTDFKIQITSSEPEGPFAAYANELRIRNNQRVTIVVLPRSREGGRGVSVAVTRETAPAGQPAPAAPGGPAVRR